MDDRAWGELGCGGASPLGLPQVSQDEQREQLQGGTLALSTLAVPGIIVQGGTLALSTLQGGTLALSTLAVPCIIVQGGTLALSTLQGGTLALSTLAVPGITMSICCLLPSPSLHTDTLALTMFDSSYPRYQCVCVC